MAGARIGYCLTSPEVVEDLRRVRLPYHLSALSQTAGLVALDHRGEAEQILAAIRKERDRILEALPPMGAEVFPSHANFVLFRPDEAGRRRVAGAARPRRADPRLQRDRSGMPPGDRRYARGGRPLPVRARGGPDVTRSATVERATKETSVKVELALDGSGSSAAETGLPFFDHMLQQLGTHAGFDLTVRATGDLEVDGHHTVEDVGLALGQALREALGDKRGIRRFASITVPLDEAAVEVALDLSGRPFVVHEVDVPAETIGSYDTGLTEDFVRAFATAAEMTLHVRLRAGRSPHHIVEAEFKALAKCLQDAVRIVGTDVPSTKGTL